MVTPPTITVAGARLDPRRVGTPVQITLGRSTPNVQPDPPAAVFQWLGAEPPFNLGDSVLIEASIGGSDDVPSWADPAYAWDDPGAVWGEAALEPVPRFTGTVETIDVALDVGELDVWAVGCLGTSATVARQPVRLERQRETDFERVAAIAADAGITVAIRGTETVHLIPDNIRRNALSALHEIAASSGAIVWEDPDGTIIYGARDYRVALTAKVWLTPSEVLHGLNYTRNTVDVTNDITIGYGTGNASNTYRDTDSIAAWGLRATDIDTLLDDEVDADALGTTILGRRRNPRWALDTVAVDSSTLTPPNRRELMRVTLGQPISLPIAHDPDGPRDPTLWAVEGWAEVWDHANGPLEQALAIYCTHRDLWGDALLRTYAELAEQTYAHWALGTYFDALIREIGYAT